MKFVKKSELQFKNGYITLEDEIVAVDALVPMALNVCETAIQEAKFWKQNQLEPQKVVEFKRESALAPKHDAKAKQVATPVMDGKLDEALKLAAEIEGHGKSQAMQNWINQNGALLAWLDGEDILIDEAGIVQQFDLPTLGNPLTLTAQGLVDKMEEVL